MKTYAEPAIKGFTRDIQWKVVRGVADTELQAKEAPREREYEKWRAREAAKKLQRKGKQGAAVWGSSH